MAGDTGLSVPRYEMLYSDCESAAYERDTLRQPTPTLLVLYPTRERPSVTAADSPRGAAPLLWAAWSVC